jgi:hypothetical protein
MQKSFCHIWSLDINLQNGIKTLARLGVLPVNPQVVWQDGIKKKTLAMLGVLPINPQVVWQDGTKILAMPGIRNLLPTSLSWCGRATLIIGRARCDIIYISIYIYYIVHTWLVQLMVSPTQADIFLLAMSWTNHVCTM